jgi:hypothetical protein
MWQKMMKEQAEAAAAKKNVKGEEAPPKSAVRPSTSVAQDVAMADD